MNRPYVATAAAACLEVNSTLSRSDSACWIHASSIIVACSAFKPLSTFGVGGGARNARAVVSGRRVPALTPNAVSIPA